jgi:hypothetical protein
VSGEATAEALSFARSAVLRAIWAAGPDSEGSAIDEDTLMRIVPLLERHDRAWLEQVLANEDLPLDGRKEIYAHTGEISEPWSAGKDPP